jgi:hypothetical protein
MTLGLLGHLTMTTAGVSLASTSSMLMVLNAVSWTSARTVMLDMEVSSFRVVISRPSGACTSWRPLLVRWALLVDLGSPPFVSRRSQRHSTTNPVQGWIMVLRLVISGSGIAL